MDLHSHLSTSEVIGCLGGTWNFSKKGPHPFYLLLAYKDLIFFSFSFFLQPFMSSWHCLANTRELSPQVRWEYDL